MTTAFTSSISYAELKIKNSLPARPRLHFDLPVDTANHDHDAALEDMMTDSTTAGTPPLDLTSDSDDEYPVTMRSPLSPTTVQPVSILLHRKRKDSQEEHVSALNLFERQRGQHDAEYAALPTLQGYGKGARGRRPTVTFDLDNEPSSQKQHKGPLSVLPHNRHDDVGARETVGSVDFIFDGDDEATLGSEVPDGLLAAEHALRRVSITLPAEASSITPLSQSPDSINDDTAMPSTTLTTITAAPTITADTTTTTEEESITTSVVENSAPQAAPQEIIINHITAEDAPQDLLVALFDRSSELEALAARHSDFFNLIYSSLSKSCREPFKTLLFTPRSSLGDRDWMQAIEQQLSTLPPCILEKFKGIVGWIGPEGDEDERKLWGEDEYGYRDSSFEQVQIKWLRDIPDFPLETFEQCYPQFFVNARDRLQGRRMSYGGDQRDHYAIFCETLQLSRDDLPCDNAWARRMNGCLEKHPELLLQLKEIIAYETGYDDD
ncbi:MAG: hypothetical protein JOS17DRAFT_222307 [Linnemannia elongata]|nr:MAG: hypothetical protein JOS17DRAFT_222307 [Linnemannia elongata]